MDTKKYLERKATGSVTLAKIGHSYAASYKKYDESTGAELNSEIEAVDVDELLVKKASIQQEITEIDAIIADINAIKE